MNYLCSPYSHKRSSVRNARAHLARAARDALTKQGHVVFSPIVESHSMAAWRVLVWNDPWWYEWSMDFLRHADEVWVLMLDGWRESTGVCDEIRVAKELGKRVRYVDPKNRYTGLLTILRL